MNIFPTIFAAILGILVAGNVASTFSSGGGFIGVEATYSIDLFLFSFIFFFMFWFPFLVFGRLIGSSKASPATVMRAKIFLIVSFPFCALSLWYYLGAPAMASYRHFHL
jgi:hypothetical protein